MARQNIGVAIKYHDYCNSFSKYGKKLLRHEKYGDILKHQFPDILKFAKSYDFV